MQCELGVRPASMLRLRSAITTIRPHTPRRLQREVGQAEATLSELREQQQSLAAQHSFGVAQVTCVTGLIGRRFERPGCAGDGQGARDESGHSPCALATQQPGPAFHADGTYD